MTVRCAMIMGAGLGTRMRPLTDDRPKPLVMVAGKTLIDHAIDRLVAAGVSRIVVNLHYRAAMLRAHLAQRRDVQILFSDESDALLDTGGGVAKALPFFEDAPFFVLNVDSIWVERAGSALGDLARAWNDADMDGLLLLADRTTAMGYDGAGDFVLAPEARVSRARHHPSLQAYAYPGVQIVHPRLFTGAPPGAFSTNLMWDAAIARGRLYGAVLDGVWLHVGTPQARNEAEEYLLAQGPA